MPPLLRALLSFGPVLLAIPAAAQERIDYGPFYYLTAEPDRLYLDGALTAYSAEWFWQAINVSPEITMLVLNSAAEAGGVRDALVIADIVSSRRMDTYVPRQSACTSTCALVLLAGVGRVADGTLPSGDSVRSPTSRSSR